jgi:hypothetical protein
LSSAKKSEKNKKEYNKNIQQYYVHIDSVESLGKEGSLYSNLPSRVKREKSPSNPRITEEKTHPIQRWKRKTD